MTDIVKRLRGWQGKLPVMTVNLKAMTQEAANEIERLRAEGTAMKQALGYPVPADEEVINNPFKCGTCEAKTNEIERLRELFRVDGNFQNSLIWQAAAEIERLRASEAAWEETRRAVAHLNNENAALKARFDRDSTVR